MKRIIKLIFATLPISIPTMTWADTLNYDICTHENDRQLEASPINNISISFSEFIELTDHAFANITYNGEEVAIPLELSVENKKSTFSEHEFGYFDMTFDNLCLPKGRDYEIRVSAGSICALKDANKLNDEIIVKYSVPEDIGYASFNNIYADEKVNCITCCWRYAVKAVDGSEWELYREDVLIGKYPVISTSDWGIGFAHCYLGETTHYYDGIYLDNGATYRLVLPEGSVRTARTDIVNKREEIVFVGGVATTSVEDIESDSTPAVRCADRTITVSGLNGTERVRVVSADGKIIRDTAAGSGNLNITLSAPGLHIVTVDDTAHKVLVR